LSELAPFSENWYVHFGVGIGQIWTKIMFTWQL